MGNSGWIAQLDGRNVDRQLDPVPPDGVGARLAQHPQADGIDQPASLGDGDERGRAFHRAIGPAPAQQRLGRDDLAAAGIDQRLVGQRQLAAVERLAQVLLDLAHLVAVAVEILVEPGAAVLAAFLGRVHGHVRPAQQLRRAERAVPRAARQADAGADGELALVDLDRLDQAHQQGVADAFEDVACNGPHDQDGEFVPA